MQSASSLLVVLGTGGTIAGRAADAADAVGYRAGEVPVGQLLGGIAPPAGLQLECEQLAQLDSKDMDAATWQRLAQRAAQHLDRPEVRAVVVTHGTDTLEETAWLLHRVLAPTKPLVLTAAMRPATALLSDGPQNLADALAVAASPGVAGVLVVMAGRVHAAADVRKRHSFSVDAFDSGEAGVLAVVEQGELRCFRPWPRDEPLGLACIGLEPGRWPWIEIVTSHADARGAAVDALSTAGVDGLVVAATGNGTVHERLAAALDRAVQRGVAVVVTTRCADGAVVTAGGPTRWPVLSALRPVQARVELLLRQLAASRGGHGRRDPSSPGTTLARKPG